jgi:hypothetical protein
MTRKRTPVRKPRKRSVADMRREYRIDYRRSHPNRFVTQFPQGAIAVVLDADVAAVFDSSEQVNAFLRSAIAAMPHAVKRRRRSAV